MIGLSGGATPVRKPADPGSDPQAFLRELVDRVSRALPSDVVARVLVVKRQRSLSDRIFGRRGVITQVRAVGANQTLTLKYNPGQWPPAGWAQSQPTGAASRRAMTREECLTTFAERVAALAADAAGDEVLSDRARHLLGVQPAATGIRVREDVVESDLRTLPARLGGHVPSAAIAQVGRIVDILLDTLPRVLGQGEPEIIVRRIATVYLPDTLHAYLALPADWAATHVYPDGTSPAQALITQLAALESAAMSTRDSALRHDATALLINGRFLSERFASPRLDLP